MKNGFNFELYETLFTNCFINTSRYKDGGLQLSLFGTDPSINETAHFADITLEQNRLRLADNEIVVDCKYKPSLIPQLVKLGILKSQIGTFVKENMMYPIYSLNEAGVNENEYCMQAVAA